MIDHLGYAEKRIAKNRFPQPVYFVSEFNDRIDDPEYIKSFGIFGRIYVPFTDGICSHGPIYHMEIFQLGFEKFDYFVRNTRFGNQEFLYARTLAPKIRPKSHHKDARQEIAIWGGPNIKSTQVYQIIVAYPTIRRCWVNLFPDEKFPVRDVMGYLGDIIQAEDLTNSEYIEELRNTWYDQPENYPENSKPIIFYVSESAGNLDFDDELERAMR